MSYPNRVRRTVVRELQVVHDVRGTLPTALVRELADEYDVATSTVWRWWREGRADVALLDHRDGPPTVGLPVPTDDQIEVIFANAGNISAAHRQLMSDPETAETTPSRRTLADWWSNCDATLRAYVTGGASALLDKQMSLRHTVEGRNMLWRIDHQEWPVWMLPNGRSSTPVKPWVTTVLDDCTRTTMSLLVTVERPDATSVGVALADAMRFKDTTVPGVRVGGVPDAVHSDNGGEFRSDQYRGMLRELGIDGVYSAPYVKRLNGKVERIQQTMQHDLAKVMPGWADGPRTLTLKTLFALEEDLLVEELATEILLDWVERYNRTHRHAALDGRTPLEAWAAQHTPLREPDMIAVRRAMMKLERQRKVTPDGISVGGVLYTSPELARLRLVDRHVDVRLLPHDDSFIEVFHDDEWLCTAIPSHRLDKDERDLLMAVRDEQYTTARAFQAAARERRVLAAATASLESPALQPNATPRSASLLDGADDALFELTVPTPATTPARVAPPAQDEAQDDQAGPADPWDLTAISADDNQLEDLL